MHMLLPGAPIDSSAGLCDRNIHAKCCPTIRRDYLSPRQDSCPPSRVSTTPQGHFIRDSLVVPLHKSQAVSRPSFVRSRPTYAGCDLFLVVWISSRDPLFSTI